MNLMTEVALCLNCRYWHEDASSCRARSPRTGGMRRNWPTTYDEDWCGDWRPRRQDYPKQPNSTWLAFLSEIEEEQS